LPNPRAYAKTAQRRALAIGQAKASDKAPEGRIGPSP